MIDTNEESKQAWETNAEFWDDYMGDESNFFHRDLVRPYTEELLEAKADEIILDIACGNGNFSERLASQGVNVIAVDYSQKMIDLAVKRRKAHLERIVFKVCDATNEDELLSLAHESTIDKVVANMALMDISAIVPLFRSLSKLIKTNGCFVFSLHHPCFTFPNQDYFQEQTYKGEAIEGQPVPHNYYHRSLTDLMNLAFEHGFYIDGFHEVPFPEEKEPIICIVRVRKK